MALAALIAATVAGLSGSRLALAQQLAAHGGGAADAAASREFVLRWEAPAGCPTAAQVRATIARLLESDRTRGGENGTGPLEVHATITTAGGTSAPWRLRLETVRGTSRGQRALADTRCRPLADAAALVVAMTLDPRVGGQTLTPQSDARPAAPTAETPRATPDAATTAAPDTEVPAASPSDAATPAPATGASTATAPAPASTTSTPVATPDAAREAPVATTPRNALAVPAARTATALASRPRAPRPAARARALADDATVPDASGPPPPSPARGEGPARLALGAGASGDTGMLPGVSFGARLLAAALLRHWRFEFAVGYWPARLGTVPQHPGAGGEVDAFSLGATACRTAMFGLVELGGCALADGAVVRARGVGVSAPGQGTAPWFALGAAGALALVPWRHLAFRAQVGALVPIVRPDFFLEGVGTAHQAAWIVGRATLEVEVRF